MSFIQNGKNYRYNLKITNKEKFIMKKKITLITSILLILALAVTFVGCNKDKTEETPTTTEKVSTTEPTTKFEVPEIKDEPTTEETTASTTEEVNEKDGNGSKKNVTSKTKTSKNSKSSSVGSLRSSGTAKTGDETPVAVMGFMLIMTTAGFFVLRKKSRTEK